MTNFRISIVSDTVCPWCYVGHRKMLLAQKSWRERFPNDTFSVTYKPYQLNPDSPPRVSRNKMDVYAEKFGADRTAAIVQHMRKIGEPLGIKFSYGGQTGNTRDSHRVIHLAQKLGGEELQLKTVEGLFAAYFEHERDITSLDMLKDVATKAGIPEKEFQKSIVESDEGGAEVDRAVGEARYGGVSGVPDYTIQDKYNFSGGQDPEVFLSVFEKVKASEGS